MENGTATIQIMSSIFAYYYIRPAKTSKTNTKADAVSFGYKYEHRHRSLSNKGP